MFDEEKLALCPAQILAFVGVVNVGLALITVSVASPDSSLGEQVPLTTHLYFAPDTVLGAFVTVSFLDVYPEYVGELPAVVILLTQEIHVGAFIVV